MILYTDVRVPDKEVACPVLLSDDTMQSRLDSVLCKMRKENFDTLAIWADLEHGSNFEYLVGFLPRFEEALLVLHQDGSAYLVLGNENLNKASKARLKVTPVHMPHFSLPNQPMMTDLSIDEILRQCHFENTKKLGIVGWKNFTSAIENNLALFDLPVFVMDGLKKCCLNTEFVNATYLFIGENGVRTQNNANEFAHYEYGATLAGNCILDAMNAVELGKEEREVACFLDKDGQTHNVVSIMATGARFEKANMYPSDKTISLSDTISLTSGYKGGLQSRAGYAVFDDSQLPDGKKDYLDRVAKPYYQAVVTWLESIHIGMSGSELYDQIERVLPKEKYGWTLNPGHLCADEEWLSSPIYPGSKEIIKSGMLFQIDIIPSVKGYGGISCESGILLADETLRKEIESKYPELYKRVLDRQEYMRNELGINISDEILPTSMLTAYCRPYLLNRNKAFKNKK